jgi:hypothetical protein
VMQVWEIERLWLSPVEDLSPPPLREWDRIEG